MDGLRKAWEFLTKLSIYLAVASPRLHPARMPMISWFSSTRMRTASHHQFLKGFATFALPWLCLISNRISVLVLFPLDREKLYLYFNYIQWCTQSDRKCDTDSEIRYYGSNGRHWRIQFGHEHCRIDRCVEINEGTAAV